MASSLRASAAPLLVVTCEHATARVPARYQSAFVGKEAQQALESHRGVDFGAKEIARALARHLEARYFEASMTRLLVDLNRAPHHPKLFSEFSKELDGAKRAELKKYHEQYRADLLAFLRHGRASRVVHLAIHSFTPRFEGVTRKTDFGALYDPSRPGERALGQALKASFAQETALTAHANQPYRGVADGVPTWLRKELGKNYIGLELEFNQRHLKGPAAKRTATRFAQLVAKTVRAAVFPRK